MKNLIIANGVAVIVDPATLDVETPSSDREAIQRIWRVKEDCKIKAVFGEETFEKDAKAGDIVMTFYEKDYPNKMIVIRSDEWNENLAAYDVKVQALKEKWANEQSEHTNEIHG